MAKKTLKLFVWEEVLTDYTDGVMFALAHDTEEARKLIVQKLGYEHGDLAQEPKIITEPEGFFVYGGG